MALVILVRNIFLKDISEITIKTEILRILLCLCCMTNVTAQTDDEVLNTPRYSQHSNQVVSYSSDFFSAYQPNTALDIVQSLPGFQINDGSNLRGFSGAAGNVLINGRRPSSKQDTLSAILTRIPASYVESIDLYKGQVGDIDLQGQTVVANIILLNDVDAAIRWQASLRKNFNNSQLGPGVEVSLSDRWNDVDYNAGISFRINPRNYRGPENVFDGIGVKTSTSSEQFFRDTKNGEINLISSTDIQQFLVRFNTRLGYLNTDSYVNSNRDFYLPVLSSQYERVGRNSTSRDIELGMDLERALSDSLFGKIILLYFARNNDTNSDQVVRDVEDDAVTLFKKSLGETDTRESIGRLEFDWTGIASHVIQANFEVAYNSVTGSLKQTENTGLGRMDVVVPGANTSVQETRWDILLQDTWNNESIVFNYGFGIEQSKISSQGDDDRIRNFTFLKPHAQLTYAIRKNLQLRLRFEREVAQLDFNDFISTSVFEDDDLALGNIELIPEKKWSSQISLERRFGNLGVITLTGFYHAIDDIQDLLPVSDEFEVAGNIGDGERWGVEMENTIPLGWLGLANSRLDIKARWQDSSVIDPVTGLKRIFSGKAGFGSSSSIPFRDDTDEFEYIFDVAYRQDFDLQMLSWGWDLAERGKRILFKVNELDVVDEGELELNTFIETTRWLNIKFRLEAQNILNLAEERNRTLFINTRNVVLNNIDRLEIRSRTKGFRLFLALSGTY